MTAPALDAELVLDLRADLAEGPVWNGRTQRLHCVDITAAKIHDLDPATGALRTIDVGAMVGCVALRKQGGLVAALGDGLWSVDPESGQKKRLLTPAGHDATRCRFNDGKCDPQGRLWAGTMALDGRRESGALYCFPSAGEVRRELDAVSVSNGLAWSRDAATLYYIDSPTRRVDAFDFDAETGRLARRRPAIALPPGNDVPDGCAIDDEDMLWVAHWNGGGVSRWDPRTGRKLAWVRVPAPRVTSCAFGGSDHRTLFITTARQGLSASERVAYPKSGGIFACRPGVGGPPAVPFRG